MALTLLQPPEHEKVSLTDLAREALTEADGIVEAAVAALGHRLQSDPALLDAVLQFAIHDALVYRTQAASRGERRAIIRRATDPRSSVVALAKGIAASLLDMPLAGGIRLRSCGRAFVQQEADRFNGLARDCARKGRFLGLIAQSVPDGQTVGDAISDGRALELWEGCADGQL